ncbi:MAG: arginase family hydrolase, arginase/agmainase/formiminoglutamate hydrolase [Bacteroidetes bacterium]|jgi:arginase family enzyme|nr:arginase family hydrolase, arginase/agmainase/formiminoglutamate hydrolase [Bacteroidota bacterium]
MSDIAHFFSPVDMDTITNSTPLKELQFGNLFSIHTDADNFPELSGVDIAIVGVAEDRNSENNKGCKLGPDSVRGFLYKLYGGSFEVKVADLGNINPGHSTDDTYFALKTTVDHLVRNNIIPVIIGGSQDLTYAQFLGYKDLEQTINIAAVDSVFDLGNPDEDISNLSYLGKIILHQPNYLFNYSNIGYQSYLVDQSSLQMMNKLYFDVYRLGQIRDKIEEAEPIIRQADMITFDITAIKHSDAPANPNASPNGFYAEEACQMMRYAGMNDKLSSLGIYEINPEFDVSGKTAHLAAQMIWCFMDGFYNRKNDFPSRTNPEYLRFHVVLQDEKYEINFYKSKKSDRWWMEIPYPPHKDLKFERHTLIPCNYKDYEMATANEIPDRWWQTYQKLS